MLQYPVEIKDIGGKKRAERLLQRLTIEVKETKKTEKVNIGNG